MKALAGFLAGGVAAALIIGNMTGSFTPRLADVVAPIEIHTVSNQASPDPSFDDKGGADASFEPDESAEPEHSAEPGHTEDPNDDRGGSKRGPSSTDDNSGPSSTDDNSAHGGTDDNSGSGSSNSGSGSSGSGSDDSSKTPRPTETPH